MSTADVQTPAIPAKRRKNRMSHGAKQEVKRLRQAMETVQAKEDLPADKKKGELKALKGKVSVIHKQVKESRRKDKDDSRDDNSRDDDKDDGAADKPKPKPKPKPARAAKAKSKAAEAGEPSAAAPANQGTGAAEKETASTDQSTEGPRRVTRSMAATKQDGAGDQAAVGSTEEASNQTAGTVSKVARRPKKP